MDSIISGTIQGAALNGLANVLAQVVEAWKDEVSNHSSKVPEALSRY